MIIDDPGAYVRPWTFTAPLCIPAGHGADGHALQREEQIHRVEVRLLDRGLTTR